jgi:hypothetical protein
LAHYRRNATGTSVDDLLAGLQFHAAAGACAPLKVRGQNFCCHAVVEGRSVVAPA